MYEEVTTKLDLKIEWCEYQLSRSSIINQSTKQSSEHDDFDLFMHERWLRNNESNFILIIIYHLESTIRS